MQIHCITTGIFGHKHPDIWLYLICPLKDTANLIIKHRLCLNWFWSTALQKYCVEFQRTFEKGFGSADQLRRDVTKKRTPAIINTREYVSSGCSGHHSSPRVFSRPFRENPKLLHLRKAPRWPSSSGEMSDVPANLSRGENERKKNEGMEIICGVEDCGKQKKNITERHRLNENMQGQGLGLVDIHMLRTCLTGGAHVGHTGFT